LTLTGTVKHAKDTHHIIYLEIMIKGDNPELKKQLKRKGIDFGSVDDSDGSNASAGR
jgi:hypothetical protein